MQVGRASTDRCQLSQLSSGDEVSAALQTQSDSSRSIKALMGGREDEANWTASTLGKDNPTDSVMINL